MTDRDLQTALTPIDLPSMHGTVVCHRRLLADIPHKMDGECHPGAQPAVVATTMYEYGVTMLWSDGRDRTGELEHYEVV